MAPPDTHTFAAQRLRTAPATATDRWIDTDAFGLIHRCSEQAALILGTMARGGVGRSVLLMFLSAKPSSYDFERALKGGAVEREAIIRACEQAARAVRYRIERSPDASDLLRWTFQEL